MYGCVITRCTSSQPRSEVAFGLQAPQRVSIGPTARSRSRASGSTTMEDLYDLSSLAGDGAHFADALASLPPAGRAEGADDPDVDDIAAAEVALYGAAEAGAIGAGLAALPMTRAPKRSHDGAFVGPANRSKAHMAFVRLARRVKMAQRSAAASAAASKGLRTAWNSMRLREGDTVGEPGEEAHAGRGRRNRWTIHGLLRIAFQAVGRVANLRAGLDGAHGTLRAVSGVACAAMLAQAREVRAHMARVTRPGAAHVIGRYYDATPLRVRFSQPHLRTTLMHLARHFARNEATGKWEVANLCPGAALRAGVMEVFAQEVTVATVQQHERTWHERVVTCPPQYLARANASCIQSACDSVQGLDLPSIAAMCKSAGVVLVAPLYPTPIRFGSEQFPKSCA